MAAIAGIALQLARHGANFLIGGINGLINGPKLDDDDLAGVDASFSQQYANRYGMARSLSSPFERLMKDPNFQRTMSIKNTPPLTGIVSGMLSDNDKKSEEVLVVTQEEVSKREFLQAILEQSHVEHLVLEMPLEGLKRCQVIVNASFRFIFCQQEPSVKEKGVTYITPGNHVEIQLIPRSYNNFTQLMNHELVKLENVHLTSQNIAGYSNSTLVGYIPYAKNTKSINNQILKTLTKLNKQYPVDYTVRYFSPALVEYVVPENDPTKAEYVPQSVYFEPNKPIRADYIRNAYNAGEKKMLSFGTFVILKENVGEEVIAEDYNIEMTFAVWDYINMGMSLEAAQKQWDEEHKNDDDDSGSGSGSSPSTGCSRRRRGVAN